MKLFLASNMPPFKILWPPFPRPGSHHSPTPSCKAPLFEAGYAPVTVPCIYHILLDERLGLFLKIEEKTKASVSIPLLSTFILVLVSHKCHSQVSIGHQKLLEIEKEIVREVVRGDKHNLRKSANCNAQISVIPSADCMDLCFAICWFSQVVFVTSNNFTHNLLFYFQ